MRTDEHRPAVWLLNPLQRRRQSRPELAERKNLRRLHADKCTRLRTHSWHRVCRHAILISLASHDVAEVSSPRESRVQRRTPVDVANLSTTAIADELISLGSIEELPSGALRVSVYAGTDPLTG